MLCRLCLQEKQLINSHVIPEFLYGPLYDDKHQFKVVSTDPGMRDRKEQKGVREKLLCSDCENKISKWENYAATLWNRNSPTPEIYDNALVFQGIDYRKFKLFQLSLIWRCSICERDEFSDLKMGIPEAKHPLKFTKHEERIRKMLLNENPGEPYEYGCIIFYSPKLTKNLKDGIILGGMVKVEGHRRHLLIIQGTFWMYFVSSHMEKLPLKQFFLQKDGTLPILKENHQLYLWLRQYIQELRNAGKI